MHKHLAISKIFDMIEAKTKVLDVGCSTGFLGNELKKKKQCTVFGIDNNKSYLNIASKRLDKAIYADIEKNNIKLKTKSSDYIIFADILEHTRDPESMIKKFKAFLKDSGSFLISLPNVAHPINRINLLLGRWNCTDYGILDRTHLRFFTYKSSKKMIENSGLKIIDERKAGRLTLKKTLAAQFVFRCVPR